MRVHESFESGVIRFFKLCSRSRVVEVTQYLPVQLSFLKPASVPGQMTRVLNVPTVATTSQSCVTVSRLAGRSGRIFISSVSVISFLSWI